MISVTNFKILRTKFELLIFQDFQEILLKICPDSRSIDLSKFKINWFIKINRFIEINRFFEINRFVYGRIKVFSKFYHLQGLVLIYYVLSHIVDTW
jgi:hypothetical protein